MRYGIFGGSFNPVHNGHIIIAQLTIEYLKLEKLFIVPAYIPPHKSCKNLINFEKRYKWVIESFRDLKKIEISDFEIKKGGLSYTIDTIEFFVEKIGSVPFLIIGEDMAKMFHKWYRYEDILKKSKVCVYPRYREKVSLKLGDRFLIMDLPLIQISSTNIRQRIKEGKSIKGFVPDSIIQELLEVYSAYES